MYTCIERTRAGNLYRAGSLLLAQLPGETQALSTFSTLVLFLRNCVDCPPIRSSCCVFSTYFLLFSSSGNHTLKPFVLGLRHKHISHSTASAQCFVHARLVTFSVCHSLSQLAVTYSSLRGTSIDTFQWYFTEGAETSQDLVHTFLARIDEVNNETRAVAETNPDGLRIAQVLDQERRRSGPRRFVGESSSSLQSMSLR
jgi:hypothetical protein